MKRILAISLFLMISLTTHAQSKITDPYKGKPFKPGVQRALHLQVPVGKIVIDCNLKYTLLDDPDGMFYAYGQRYKARIDEATATANSSKGVPQEIIEGFADKTIELTSKEIMSRNIRTPSMYFWFTVQDYNLDSKPDFAFIRDWGYHSNLVTHYVWVNIGGHLVYWHNLADVVAEVEDSAKRIINIKDDSLGALHYRIEKDTTLIPFNR